MHEQADKNPDGRGRAPRRIDRTFIPARGHGKNQLRRGKYR